MAGFKTHVTTSTAIGIAYGAGAYAAYDVPWPSCLLAGGLCGVSGMLPDLDSEPGVPLRESVSFAAAVVPMLMIQRWQQLELSRESIVLVSGLLYLLIRFGFGHLLSSLTVHRGMFHSLPALAIVGELTYLVCAHENPWMRCFFAVAVMCGFASHLVLDEIWSLDLKHLRVKSSFGTAVKLWGDCWWANLATYANVVILALLITQDRMPEGKPLPGKTDMIATQPEDRQF
jgi:hypothetical protein